MESTDEFKAWYRGLNEGERGAVIRVMDMLEICGPTLGFPQSSDIKTSRHGEMRELRIQHAGRPYRVLYAFDPRRTAVLLLGDDKTGDARWYKRVVRIADDLYDAHLRELREEGLI